MLPRQVAIDFERLTGARLHEGYGLTEGSCASTVNPPEGQRKLGTVGLRLPYQEIELFELGADTARTIDGHPMLVTFCQPELEAALRRRLANYSSVEIQLGVTLDGFVYEGSHVQATLKGVMRCARSGPGTSSVLMAQARSCVARWTWTSKVALLAKTG
ncbi:hypothetical protein [Dyella sp. Tek66A03]|uniref:hypothetical protein n=1 Tax=Dyella sp. Tek66A03 TaxID=3458298 RepID=UPI00403E9572